MRATLKLIMKALITIIATALITIIAFVLMIFCIAKCNKGEPVPTDVQMIEHFKLNETFFEELHSMIENDSLRRFPLYVHEKKEGKVLPISVDRELEYDSLMKKIQVTEFRAFSPFRENSILFFHFIKGDATWGIEKGFEYVFDRSKEDDKEFTERELYDLVIEKHENCQLYKKINDNWNLFIFYDR